MRLLDRVGELWIGTLALILAISATPIALAIECRVGSQVLPIDNDRVLQFKYSTPNGYKAQARVQGEITRVFPDQTRHNHFEIQIGSGPDDTLEVIYAEENGRLPAVAPGMTVEACGEYITANGGRAPSPSRAIIHWVHVADPARGSHPSGYLLIDGAVCGQGRDC
jgi:hypothetical protein